MGNRCCAEEPAEAGASVQIQQDLVPMEMAVPPEVFSQKTSLKEVAPLPVLAEENEMAPPPAEVLADKPAPVNEKKLTDTPLPDAEGDLFVFELVKLSKDEKMGFKVKHVNGTLLVVRVTDDGAIHRTNTEHEARAEPVLRVDDTILKVNDVEGADHEMVAECRFKDELVMQVLRPRK